jgi:hypothetical protein
MTLVEHDKKKSYQDFKIQILKKIKIGVGKGRTPFFPIFLIKKSSLALKILAPIASHVCKK